jgi:hypothetical protein
VTLSVAQANRLVVTVTWTDPAAGLGADKPMVNVLAPTMTDQTGTTLLGNVAAGGSTPDAVNSTQMVVTAAAGKWTVTVSAPRAEPAESRVSPWWSPARHGSRASTSQPPRLPCARPSRP